MAKEAQWDPAAVIARAKELIHASNYGKVGEARAAVDAAIDEWTRATQALAEGSVERRQAAACVAEAWGLYAQLEMELRQFKQATKVFESAVGCAVSRDATALWLQYAAFCVDRKKLSNARKVFARAVFAVPEAERGHVWTLFHAFVCEHIDPNMTLEALQAQMQAALPGPPSNRASPTNATAVPSPNGHQVAGQSTEAAASVAQSEVVGSTDAATTVTTPSPTIGGGEKPAEAAKVTDEGVHADAPSTAQVSSADSNDAPHLADDSTAEESTAKPTGIDTATPESTVDTNADATHSASEASKEASEKVTQAHDAPELVVDGDSALAFVDKTGQEPVPAELVKSVGSNSPSAKRAGSADGNVEEGANKRAKLDTDPASPTLTGVKAEPMEEPSDFLAEVPKTLPPIAGCPHLLFDPPTNADGGINTAAASELPNELVERLSDALSDSAVFEGVRELCTIQEQRDLDMLRRWQELVRMQKRERTDLYARQARAEEQNGFEDTRGLIELKMKHLEQRHEFVSRCLTSQKQFIDICAMDRADSLRAQQISLVNMKVPEMEVTTDPTRIELQRAIVSVILEAEKLWRAERDALAGASKPKHVASGSSEAGAAPVSKPYNDRQRAGRDSLDSPSSHSGSTRGGGYSGGGGYNRGSSMRGGRGGGYARREGGGRGGFRRDEGRPYAGRGSSERFRRDPRRDPRKPFYDDRDTAPSSRLDTPAYSGANAGAPASARFEQPPQRPVRMQEEYDPYEPQFQRPARQQEPSGYYQAQQPPPQQQMPPPMQYAPIPGSYDAYGRLREALPPPTAPFAPQAPAPSAYATPDRYPQDPRRPQPNDRYNGPPPAATGSPEWQRGRSQAAPYRQDRQEAPQQQYRRRETLPTADRVVEYSVAVPEGEYRSVPSDPHLSRYRGGPPPAAAGRAPPAAYAAQAPPPHQQQRGYPRPQDMGPGPSSQPPPYDAYATYDYPPPQQQQQHLQPPVGGRGAPPSQFDSPQGYGGGRGGFAPQQRQPYRQQQQQQAYQQPAQEAFGYQSPGQRGPSRQGYGRGRGGGRRGGGPRQYRR